MCLFCAAGRWILENDSGLSETNQVVTPGAAAVPDVVSLPEQINTSPSTWNTNSDAANAFSLTPEAVFFQPAMPATPLHRPPSGRYYPPALHHNLVYRDLDHLSFPHSITLALHSDDMLVRPTGQEVALNEKPNIPKRHLLISHSHVCMDQFVTYGCGCVVFLGIVFLD